MSTQPKYGKLSPEQQAIADELFGAMPISKPERPAMNNPRITDTGRPMSNIDKQALREAAEKATPGDWRRASTRFNGITSQAVYPLCGKEEILANTAEKRDAEFIAAANPATVLALLDELEAKDKRIADQRGIIASARKFISEYAERGDVGAAEFVTILDRFAASSPKGD